MKIFDGLLKKKDHKLMI